MKPHKRPPWMNQDSDQNWSHRPPRWMKHGPPPDWRRKRFGLFAGLFMLFGMMAFLLLGALIIGAFFLMLKPIANGSETHNAFNILRLGGCGLGLIFPLLALLIAGRAFRGVAIPLSDVMSAADAVAEGDLTTRIPEQRKPGQFVRLTRSFNNMIEELQRADEQRRNLTADVAHELRTPLHIIQGNLEGVLDGVYDPSPDHIKATLDETRTLARLVDDLHTLSKAEAGQLSLLTEPIDIVDLLGDVQTSFSGQAESKGIDLSLILGAVPTPFMILGDAGRLDQAFSNLVVNGLRHTPSGGRIELSVIREKETAVISISDSGAGIPAEELPHIFNRFWRGDDSRSHADGAGAGLGLAITKQLIEAHHGTIMVESVVDKGTIFRISLPTRQEEGGE